MFQRFAPCVALPTIWPLLLELPELLELLSVLDELPVLADTPPLDELLEEPVPLEYTSVTAVLAADGTLSR